MGVIVANGAEKLYQVTNPPKDVIEDLQKINVSAEEPQQPLKPFFDWLENITSMEKGKSYFDWLN